jgi:hypothetical protein
MKKHYRKENNCLNCGAELQGHFCHVCGQENLEIKESFGHMMNHAVSDYFHFDHQFFHTLKPLLFKPGFLTNEYMAGHRVQYLHPVKMYIFISVVYFLLAFKGGHKLVSFGADPKTNKAVTESIRKDINSDTTLSPAEKKRALHYAQAGQRYGVSDNSRLFTDDGDSTLAQYTAKQATKAPKDRDNFFERTLTTSFLQYNEKYGHNAKEQFEEDIQHNIPKMMFVMLPLFALILGLSFYKSRKFYVEHLIFAFHFHCFFFLFAGIMMLIAMPFPVGGVVDQCVNLVAVLYSTWYLYRALRVVYHRSRVRTITKEIGLAFSYAICLLVGIVAVTLITAMI